MVIQSHIDVEAVVSASKNKYVDCGTCNCDLVNRHIWAVVLLVVP